VRVIFEQTDLSDGTGIFTASAEIRIDLVSDPIILQKNGEERAY